MLISKESVIVYTVQLDPRALQDAESRGWRPVDLFRREFERAGMDKEAQRMGKGGFSYRETERNSYFVEYKISITTRTKLL